MTINGTSVDGVLGIRNWGGRMEGADEPTELWRHPYHRDSSFKLISESRRWIVPDENWPLLSIREYNGKTANAKVKKCFKIRIFNFGRPQSFWCKISHFSKFWKFSRELLKQSFLLLLIKNYIQLILTDERTNEGNGVGIRVEKYFTKNISFHYFILQKPMCTHGWVLTASSQISW